MSPVLLFSELASRALAVLPVLVFRSIPFLLYACATRSLPWSRRLVLVVLSLVGGAASFRAGPDVARMIEWAPAVAAYFLLGAVLVHRLATWLPKKVVARGAVLALAAGLFVLGPPALVHHPVVAPSLVLGWEVMLSAHSYCADVATSGKRPPLGDCVFFLLVNPTVIYAERGAPLATAAKAERGALRVIVGAVTMLGRDLALLLVGGVAFLSASHSSDTWEAGYAHFCATQLVLLLGLYCAHSGLASVQIGWMRLLGHTVPERYRCPLFSRDPQDFWHRWNIWVSRWAGKYFYLPIAHAIGRRRRGRVGPLLGALATFGGVGLLHDLGIYAFRLQRGWTDAPSLRLTLLFLVFALVVVAWREIARRGGRLVQALTPRARWALQIVSRLALANVAFALAALAIPVLRTGQFPPVVEAMLPRWMS